MKDRTPFSQELFDKTPLIGILRGWDMESVLWVAEVCSEVGLTTLEITMNTPNVTEIISKLSRDFPQLNIGAGTVCSMQDLEDALDAGAQFIVTPILNEEVIRKCVSGNIPIFPGAYSPTEIYRAWDLGASAVKVFPAGQLGPGYIRDILAPLGNIKLLPTGGVTKENIKSFFEAGAIGAGLGSALLDKELIRNRNLQGLKRHVLGFIRQIPEHPQ